MSSINVQIKTFFVRLVRSIKITMKQYLIAYLFILPAFAFFVLFMVYPLLDGLRLSFYKWDGISARKFVGLINYINLFNSRLFYLSFRNTVLFTVVTTTVKIIIGFLLAAALHLEIPGWRFFRTIFYLNVILPMTAIGILWAAILNPNGPLSVILGIFNQKMPSLLGNPKLVMWVLSFIDIWKYSGFPMIFLYTAMEAIPKELYEAAELDGVSGIKKLYFLTLPLIKPVLLTITMLQTIFSFKVFDIVFTMTKGGPGDASQVLTYMIYQEGLWFLRIGGSSALSVVFLIIVLIFSYFYIQQGKIGQSEFQY